MSATVEGMNRTQDSHTSAQPQFLRFRFRAAADLRGLSIEGMARSCEVSARHFWYVVTSQRRPSAALLAKMRELLGEPGWLFATGQTDTLRDDCTAGEVANHAAS